MKRLLAVLLAVLPLSVFGASPSFQQATNLVRNVLSNGTVQSVKSTNFIASGIFYGNGAGLTNVAFYTNYVFNWSHSTNGLGTNLPSFIIDVPAGGFLNIQGYLQLTNGQSNPDSSSIEMLMTNSSFAGHTQVMNWNVTPADPPVIGYDNFDEGTSAAQSAPIPFNVQTNKLHFGMADPADAHLSAAGWGFIRITKQ